jgi:hypothetical protein
LSLLFDDDWAIVLLLFEGVATSLLVVGDATLSLLFDDDWAIVLLLLEGAATSLLVVGDATLLFDDDWAIVLLLFEGVATFCDWPLGDNWTAVLPGDGGGVSNMLPG